MTRFMMIVTAPAVLALGVFAGGCGDHDCSSHAGGEAEQEAVVATAQVQGSFGVQQAETGHDAGTVEANQSECPVMGGRVNRSIHADHEGKRVYFCCPACIEIFRADPEKYVRQLEEAGVTLERVQ